MGVGAEVISWQLWVSQRMGLEKKTCLFFFYCFFVQVNIIVPAENLENIDTGRKENVQNDFSLKST